MFVCLFACLDGSVGGWDGWLGEWMGGWVSVWVGGWVDGWMDGWVDGWMHYVYMFVCSRVPCSRERELGGPYHWGGPGVRSPVLIYRICMRCAHAKPVRACTLRNWCLVLHFIFQAPLETSYLTVFTLHTSHRIPHPSQSTHTSRHTVY